MHFEDFKDNPHELVGNRVLCSNKYHQSIRTIERVTKNAFKISGSNELYYLKSGWRKDGDRWNQERCQLLTNDEAVELLKTWRMKQEEKALREQMLEKVKNMDFEQLKKVELI